MHQAPAHRHCRHLITRCRQAWGLRAVPQRPLVVATAAAVLGLASCVATAVTSDPAGVQHERSTRSVLAREYLARLQGYGLSSALLVARGDTVTVASGFGLADRERQAAFSARTIFDIGSITKQFTAAAILRLAADGRLGVHDSLGRHLPGVPADKRGITLHHLLTHTSGLPMGLGGDYERVSRDTLVSRAMRARLASLPGERHAYSNAGYSLLAAVVEYASGRSYEEFVRERLFEPAGLTVTGYSIPASVRHRLAAGYRDTTRWGIGADRTDAMGGEFWNLLGNGGLQSSVEDLHRWARALLDGRVLPPDAVTMLMTPHVLAIADYRTSGAPLYYGYGWYVWEHPDGRIVFHDGGNGIFYASLRLYRDDGHILAYGSNVSAFAGTPPIAALDRIMAGEAVTLPSPVPPTFTHASAARWEGRYETGAGAAALEVRAHRGTLRVIGDGQRAFAFVDRGAWSAAPVLDTLNRALARFMEHSRTRRYDSLAAYIRAPTTMELIRRVETSFWARRDSTLGAFVRTRVLGTRPALRRTFPARSFVAVDFARGTSYREFLWDSTRTFSDYGPIDEPPHARFFATSADCFEAFDAARASKSTLCFSGQGDRQQLTAGSEAVAVVLDRVR